MNLSDFWLRRHGPVFAPEDGTGAAVAEGTDEAVSTGDTSPDAGAVSTVLGGTKPDAGETSESGEAQETETEGGSEGTEDAVEGPPEDGQYTFDLPEGMELDSAMAEKLSPVLAELGLNNKQANQLAAAYMEAGQAAAQAQVDAWVKTNADWVEAAKADKAIKEMGWDVAIQRGKTVLELFDTEGDLSKALGTGAVNGNHPALIRFLARAGAALANDKTETGTSGGGLKDVPPEDRWYPNQKG